MRETGVAVETTGGAFSEDVVEIGGDLETEIGVERSSEEIGGGATATLGALGITVDSVGSGVGRDSDGRAWMTVDVSSSMGTSEPWEGTVDTRREDILTGGGGMEAGGVASCVIA